MDPPRSVGRLLERQPPRLGLFSSILMILYVVVGSPRQVLRIFWWHLTDRDTPRRQQRIQRLAEQLRSRVSTDCRILVGYFERRLFSRDVARVPLTLEKTLHRTTPLVVAQPKNEAEILAILAFANEHRLPVYPRGISSSPFGGAVPTTNGLVMDLSSMMRILEVDTRGQWVRLEPGVRWADLAGALAPQGLAPLTTPTSRFSTVGGWASTGGLGLNGFGHGSLEEAILAARVVQPDGSVLTLEAGDPRLKYFVGTEGQVGIFSQLTLKVHALPQQEQSLLLHFPGVKSTFAFVDRLIAEDHQPSHLAFYGRSRLMEENHLFSDRTGQVQPVVEEKDSLLLHFESDAAAQKTLALVRQDPQVQQGAASAASYLWSQRFFPLKAQRIGPSQLASEVVLPRKAVPRFIDRASKLARRFGSTLALEVLISRTRQETPCVTIASFTCHARHRWDYLLRLLLVQLLTRQGLRQGGRPYGFGIWNSPFSGRRFPAKVRREIIRHKRAHDPQLLLNPMKFFRVRTRLNLPGVLFYGPFFQLTLALTQLFSPLLGLIARGLQPPAKHRWVVPRPEEEHGYALLSQTALRCTYCGACVSTCPAYLLTHDELVTGRAKLRLAEALFSEEKLTEEEAHSPFQCLRCGLCEEVCQTGLPLRDCYEVLEEWIASRQGWPKERVERFVLQIDNRREDFLWAFGLARPPWTPPPSADKPQALPTAPEEGGLP